MAETPKDSKMLISPAIEKQLQELVKIELTASHIYHYLSMWCDTKGYFGAQKWYLKQTEEEHEHAQKVMNYLTDREACAVMPVVPAVESSYENIRQVLERTLQEELKVEKAWQTFAAACLKEGDLTSFTFAQWYLNEQIQEVATVNDFLAELCMMGDTGIAYKFIDETMGK